MNGKIPFNRPAVTGQELRYINEVFGNQKFSGDGPMSQRCNRWLKDHFGTHAAFVTSSCTHALEMAAILCDLKSGDEVIVPSFGFSSIATAFARTGASLTFVDIEPATMNLDVSAVEDAIGEKTRMIVVLHYAGVGCDMDRLCAIAERYDLMIVEDAAHGMFSNYGARPLGTMGTFGCVSFHESKNIHCGEGGALIVNDPNFIERAEMIIEKGTNKMKFCRGEVPEYTWHDMGSSYVLGELNCAFLLAQLEAGEVITADRIKVWNEYRNALEILVEQGAIEIPCWYDANQHNGHIFWIKVQDGVVRDTLLTYLNEKEIMATFHYIPLHSAPAGPRYGRLSGCDRHTSRESRRLIRLPIYFGFRDWDRVVDSIYGYFNQESVGLRHPA